MKKYLSLLLAIVMVLGLFAGCAKEPAAPETTVPATEEIIATDPVPTETEKEETPEDKLIAEMNAIISDPERPLMAATIGIIKDGEIVFCEGVGDMNLNGDPTTGDTKYRIASISKLNTAIAAWQLIEQGLIDPDADASEYLGFELRNPNFPDTPITVRMIMSHTSSIREGGDNSGTYNIPYGHHISEFFTPGAEYYCNGCWAPETEAPGEYFSYCNMNYCLMGTIIERVSGERFDQYMVNHIYEPMGLTCSFNVSEMSAEAQAQIGTLYRKFNAAGQYDPINGTWTAQCDDFTNGYPNNDYSDYEIGTNGSLFGPMGSLRVSTRELCEIMLMFCNGGTYNGVQILKPETIEAMFTPVWTYDPELENGDTYWGLMNCYGMGPHIFTNTDMGDRMIVGQDLPFAGHTSEAYGLLGGMGFDRETGNGIIYIVAGTGCDMDTYYGEYSAFYGWEEALLTAGLTYADFDY